jgi:glutathione S-transferase
MSRTSIGLPRRRAGGGVTVPVLVTPDGVLGESQEILASVDERTPPEHQLFPAEARARYEVERLCRRLDEELGPKGRRLMYVHMLSQRKLMLHFNNEGVPCSPTRRTPRSRRGGRNMRLRRMAAQPPTF